MEEQVEIKHVYTGSIVEATYLMELLQENGIEAMLRNTLEESVIAGWASGSPEDAALIFVTENHYDLALKIINEYLQQIKE
ncbi:MAG: DUF2007 domain-containing protein [Bacteroidales bacterium]|nr:DUF2007 domain-containing protein [Lentimicrobiaceae bacterium]MDD5696139.1 DUF2007 domain-containing protein [Bacteroidales bacterium]